MRQKKGQDMASKLNLVAEVNAALTEYVQEVQDLADEAAKESAEATARELKANSPKREKGNSRRSMSMLRAMTTATDTGFLVTVRGSCGRIMCRSIPSPCSRASAS